MKFIKEIEPRLNKNGHSKKWAIFKCPECLQEVERRLENGLRQKSCGCDKNIKHGGKGTKLYNVWSHIKQRIFNPNVKQFKDWGGRGITICPEWTNDYIKFRDWALSNGYTEELQINRINNNGNYEPSNCNFIPAKENVRNRRGQKIKSMEMANEIRDLHATGNYTQKELAEKYNVSREHISNIISDKSWKNI